MKILMVNRPDAFTKPGGDVHQMLFTKKYLERLGIAVDITLATDVNASGYDVVHIFNMQTPVETLSQVISAKKYNKPIVLSSIFWTHQEFAWAQKSLREIFTSKSFYKLQEIKERTYAGGFNTVNPYGISYYQQQQTIIQNVDLVVPNSEKEAQLLKSYLCIDFPYFIVHNAVDITDFRLKTCCHKKATKEYVLVAARWDDRKNLLMLCKALEEVDISVIFAGSHPDLEYEYLVKQYLPKKSLIFTHLEYDELIPLMCGAKVHILPSWFETPGLSSLEAAYCGSEIVVGNKGSETEYFGDNAYYCDPGDLYSIREAVLKALNCEDNQKNQNLVNLIQDKYNWQNAAKQTLEAYERVLELACAGGGSSWPVFGDNVVKPLLIKLGQSDLHQLRKQVANQWLSLPLDQIGSMYLSSLGQTHKLLLSTGIKEEVLKNTEQTFVEQLVAHISKDFDKPKIINYLLAAMLYYRADQLPLQYNLSCIPKWFINDYLTFLFYSPPYFKEVGEADSYYYYMQRWIDYLHTSIFNHPDSSLRHNVVNHFLQLTNFIPLCFNDFNLKDICVKRAEVLEFTLKLTGHKIGYEFTHRALRRKIRLGILAAHFTPAAETFASLPVYEYISRDFEVILYSLASSGHQLEQYCRSCANSFKPLPNNLIDQVNFIRADDIDILFIATNITAVSNQIGLLSLHRLARIQATSVASIMTTGMQSIDYYISGNLTEAYEDAEQHYQENLLKLDGPAHCFSYGSEQNTATIKVERESLDMPKEAVVFVSVANLFKITPELSETWAKIIVLIPNSILMLFPYGPNWSSDYAKKPFQKQMITIFSRYGVEKDRLLILDPDPVPNRDDIKKYLKITDVYLDSYPFSGTTSLIEPLEIGLPIVSRQGTTFRSSMGAALLQELNMPELVADSEEAYIKLAIALGTEPELRKQKSDQIKQRMQANPRFLDSRAYSTQIGALFQELFRKHQVVALIDKLKLRDINIIVFPDWSQSEDLIYQDLASAITSLVKHPDKNQMTLLIATDNLSEDEANLFLSDVVMNLLLEEDFDVADGPEISLVGHLDEMQWEALLPHIQARIVLKNENEQASAQVKTETIPHCKLDSFSSQVCFRNMASSAKGL